MTARAESTDGEIVGRAQTRTSVVTSYAMRSRLNALELSAIRPAAFEERHYVSRRECFMLIFAKNSVEA
jgi:hypothetical protein